MLVKNLTRNTILSSDAKLCRSLWDQLLGLLNPENPRTLIFKSRFGIHTLLLKKSIDLIILDNDYKVVKLKSNLSPNSFFFWNLKYDLIIELPEGSIKKSKTEHGDNINLPY
jgi:uncharacterized protein